MNDEPAGHGLADRRIFDIRIVWHFPGHVKVDGVMTHAAPDPHLVEFDALDLELLEALTKYHLAAKLVTRFRWYLVIRPFRRGRERIARGVATRQDADAATQ